MNKTVDPEHKQQSENKKFFPGGFWWIALAAGILCGVVVWFSRVFGTVEGQYAFIGQNVLNVLILSAILMQALIYRRQWQSMQDALSLTRETAERDQRAYIVLQKSTIEQFAIGERIVASLTFTNAGKTPAKNVTIYSHFQHRNDLPDVSKAEQGMFRSGASKYVLGPGMISENIAIGGLLTQEFWSELANSDHRFYLWGAVVYTDMFEKRRRTTFCLVKSPEVRGKTDYCETGNDIS